MPFYKNHNPWNKGKIGVYTKETLEKMSKTREGIHNSEETRKRISESKKGCKSWNKGKCLSEEHKKKLSETHKGKVAWNKGIGGTYSLRHTIDCNFKYRQWRSDIFTRDDFTCQECGQRGGMLHAHHIKSFSKIIQFYEITTLEEALECEELWNLNNGITLCRNCHKKIHKRLYNSKSRRLNNGFI